MKPIEMENRIRIQLQAFSLDSKFTPSGFLDLLDQVVSLKSGWDLIPDLRQKKIGDFSISKEEIGRICTLVRNCAVGHHGSVNSQQLSVVAKSDIEKEAIQKLESVKFQDVETMPQSGKNNAQRKLVDEIVQVMDDQAALISECRNNARLWPFVDAYIFDESVKKVAGSNNPFDYLSSVFRAYFEPVEVRKCVKCPPSFWHCLLAFVESSSVTDRILFFDRMLLVEIIKNRVVPDYSFGSEALIAFSGSTTEVANTFLHDCPDQDGKPATLRLLILLFDLGRPGISVVPPLGRGQMDGLPQRIERLLPPIKQCESKALAAREAFREMFEIVGYVPKTIELKHLSRLMPRPHDGDESGAEFYSAAAANLTKCMVQLSEKWPCEIEIVNNLVTLLETQFDQDIYPKHITVGLEAAYMSQQMSMVFESGVDFAVGLKVAKALRKDGWISRLVKNPNLFWIF